MRQLTLAAALISVLACASSASAATTTFRPVADSYVDASRPTRNYGLSTGIKVDGSPVLKGYLKFDVAGLTEPVARATLRLYSHSSTGTGVTVHGVADDGWGESTLTAANAPAHGAAAASTGAFGNRVWVSVDVTSLVQEQGLVSVALNTTSTSSKTLSSREIAAECASARGGDGAAPAAAATSAAATSAGC